MHYRHLALFALLATGSLPAQDWPAWRGPAGNGVAPEQPVPLQWDRVENIKWQTPLAQPGNGSPIVSRLRTYILAGLLVERVAESVREKAAESV